ncbi:hypothetical protein [Pontibaca methylaminivorans]|uniref:Uncharacterized protein n=1 Tax=Pontibaca methylaminivorans TaxID=515897 RepID=A0A1R3WW81_9RHOB|nr:hypothetical protein [Pontibaca methylaminivorans]SIT81919.1 hypothetical protein SAMN05421849_1578 [Pontibaca methylaminivorans]
MRLHPHIVQMIGLIPAEDLAASWGYAGANNAFRDFCVKMGIKPVRPGWYDPHHVRHRLDAAQAITPPVATTSAPALSLVEQRRLRIGTR